MLSLNSAVLVPLSITTIEGGVSTAFAGKFDVVINRAMTRIEASLFMVNDLVRTTV